MKTLEDKILNKVYTFEARKVTFQLLAKTLILFVSGFVAFLFTQVLIEVFIEEKTYNLFEIFSDDFEVIAKHLSDIMYVIFQETPKSVLFIALLAIILLFAVILTFVRNFGKMRHKLLALYSYWKSRSV